MDESKTPTQTAFALKRISKTLGKWLEVGTAEGDSNGVIHVFLDRLPPLFEPERPAPPSDDGEPA